MTDFSARSHLLNAAAYYSAGQDDRALMELNKAGDGLAVAVDMRGRCLGGGDAPRRWLGLASLSLDGVSLASMLRLPPPADLDVDDLDGVDFGELPSDCAESVATVMLGPAYGALAAGDKAAVVAAAGLAYRLAPHSAGVVTAAHGLLMEVDDFAAATAMAAALMPSDRPTALTLQGRLHLREGEWAAAQRALTEAETLRPRHLAIRCQRAQLAMMMGGPDWEAALDALLEDFAAIDASYWRAVARMSTAHLEQAAERVDRALAGTTASAPHLRLLRVLLDLPRAGLAGTAAALDAVAAMTASVGLIRIAQGVLLIAAGDPAGTDRITRVREFHPRMARMEEAVCRRILRGVGSALAQADRFAIERTLDSLFADWG